MRIILLIIIIFLTGCRSVKKNTSSEYIRNDSTFMSINKNSATILSGVEDITINKTIFSAPDSLGNQYKVSEENTVIKKKIQSNKKDTVTISKREYKHEKKHENKIETKKSEFGIKEIIIIGVILIAAYLFLLSRNYN